MKISATSPAWKILTKITAIVCVTAIIGGKAYLIERDLVAAEQQILAEQNIAIIDTNSEIPFSGQR